MLKLIPSWQLSHADTACMLVVTPRRQYFHANCHSTLTTSPGLTVLPGWLSLETDNSTRLTILQWLTFQADGGVFRADNSTKLDIFTLVLPIRLKTKSRKTISPLFQTGIFLSFSFCFIHLWQLRSQDRLHHQKINTRTAASGPERSFSLSRCVWPRESRPSISFKISYLTLLPSLSLRRVSSPAPLPPSPFLTRVSPPLPLPSSVSLLYSLIKFSLSFKKVSSVFSYSLLSTVLS